MFLSQACRKHSCDENGTISMYSCKSPLKNDIILFCQLVRYTYSLFYNIFGVYFAILCSAVEKKNLSEKEAASTFLATKVIFVVVLSLMTLLL